MAEERDRGAGLVVGGVGGTLLGAALAILLTAKPAEAAPPEEKLNYLIDVLTALVPVLAEVADSQTTLIQLLQQWLAAQGVPGIPTVEVTVKTPWVAKEPEEIFREPITSADTFYSRIVDWTEGKRFMIKVESSLNEAVQIQVIGNIINSVTKATDINGPFPCPAQGNISIGLAFDDWHPFIGVRITTAIAPTSGLLTISAVIQE